MSQYVESYYSKTLTSNKIYPTLSGNIEVETCIIGGGLAGINIALELANRGHSVALVEAHKIGWGASGRNGGFVVPGYALGAEDLIKKVGVNHTRQLYSLINDAMQKIKYRVKKYKIDCGPISNGQLKLSLNGDKKGLQKYHNFVSKEVGLDVEYWKKDRVREAVISDYYNDGVLYKSAFQFHVLNYVRGIADAAVGHGAQIFEQSRVKKVKQNTAQKVVTVENGNTVTAKNIVYACSGYIGKLSWNLANSIVPVSTYVMNTEPLGERMKDVIRVPYALLDNRFANDYYRPLSDTRILWGGRVSVFDPKPEDVSKMLHHDMIQVFPQLKDIKVESAWGGYMGYSRHKMPQIGMTAPGVWHCTAFGGYGLAATTVGGAVMAGAITGEDNSYDLFRPFGLEFTGGSFIAPAVTQTMYWGYQLADKLKKVIS